MPRTQISIKMEPETLEAVDAAAEDLGISRTEFLERAALKALRDQGALVDEMSREPAIVRSVVDALAGNHRLMLQFAKLVAPHMDADSVQRAVAAQPKLREAANKRKSSRKGKS